MKLLRAGTLMVKWRGLPVIKYTIFTMSIIGGIFTGICCICYCWPWPDLMLPDQWLKSLITGRKEEILKDYPTSWICSA
jgi:hypothetical protein